MAKKKQNRPDRSDYFHNPASNFRITKPAPVAKAPEGDYVAIIGDEQPQPQPESQQ